MLRTKEDLILARKRLGVSQQKIAELSGVSAPTIAKIEQGQRFGSEETWTKINNALKELENKSIVEEKNQNDPRWLYKKRTAYHLTQKQLAKLIGVSESVIKHIEQGHRFGSEETWTKINNFFNDIKTDDWFKVSWELKDLLHEYILDTPINPICCYGEDNICTSIYEFNKSDIIDYLNNTNQSDTLILLDNLHEKFKLEQRVICYGLDENVLIKIKDVK